MMKTTTLFKSLLTLIAIITCMTSFGQSSAIYEITFTSIWNASDHGTLPGGAHWSNLIGSNHKNENEFLEMNMLASMGIEDVAELGSNGVFTNEINTRISSNLAEHLINVTSLSNSATGSVTLPQYQFDDEFPYLTLASMIAPSPDWFIAINSFNLREGGNWNEGDVNNEINIDLFPYDAGTEEGSSYSLSNPPTVPQENITSLVNVAPFNDQRIGYFTITFISSLSVKKELLKDRIKVFPNPTNTKSITFTNLQDSGIDNIEVYNLLGKLTLNEDVHNNSSKTIDLTNLTSGVYLAKLTSNDGKLSVSKKIVIR